MSVTATKRTPLDKLLRNRPYHVIQCVACNGTIGRVSKENEAMLDSLVRLSQVAHARECSAAAQGRWTDDGLGRWKRVARERDHYGTQPSIIGRVEKRGVAWRWVVTCGIGARNMDSGYKDTQGQAMRAADECIRLLIERGK